MNKIETKEISAVEITTKKISAKNLRRRNGKWEAMKPEDIEFDDAIEKLENYVKEL